jgi:hypothetical protein
MRFYQKNCEKQYNAHKTTNRYQPFDIAGI